jgi:cytochrome oxidase assembly protein ShyY1
MSLLTSVLRRMFLTREGLVWLLVVAIASTTCVLLGFWQWHRFEAKRDRAQVIESNYDADPVGLDTVLATPDTPLATTDQWTQVTLEGEYCTDPDCILYVRNRPYNGRTGFWQLAPFTTDQGTVLVARGWLDTTETTSEPASEPPLPEGHTTAVVRLRPVEAPFENRTSPPGQVQTITPDQVEAALPDLTTPLVTGAYGVLVSEDPAVSPMPTAVPAPDTDLGPHLSYAIQWWIFAAFFPVGMVLVLRRKERTEDGEVDGAEDGDDAPIEDRAANQTRHPVPSRRPRPTVAARARGQDEEEEDALIDGRR